MQPSPIYTELFLIWRCNGSSPGENGCGFTNPGQRGGGMYGFDSAGISGELKTSVGGGQENNDSVQPWDASGNIPGRSSATQSLDFLTIVNALTK